MKGRIEWVMCSVGVWILPRFLDSKDSEFRNAMISKKRAHNFAFSGVDIVL
jgi:hypothetical protein